MEETAVQPSDGLRIWPPSHSGSTTSQMSLFCPHHLVYLAFSAFRRGRSQSGSKGSSVTDGSCNGQVCPWSVVKDGVIVPLLPLPFRKLRRLIPLGTIQWPAKSHLAVFRLEGSKLTGIPMHSRKSSRQAFVCILPPFGLWAPGCVTCTKAYSPHL